MHHPLLGPAAAERGNTVAGRDAVLAAAADRGADVFLSGHTHVEHAAAVDLQRGGTSHSVLALEAGTAVSDRTRGAGDSINVLKTSPTLFELEVRTCRDGLYTPTMRVRFARTNSGWQAA
jgi:3',5'-cyclic AMP phosphodiesterase CpdA